MARERLGELLLRSGLLTQAQLVGALREQARTGIRLGQILVDHGLIDEVTLYDALAKVAGMERFQLRSAILERSALSLVTGEYALEHGLIPIKVDVPQRTLHVAITDPTNIAPVDELAFRLGLKIKLSIASETEIQRVVRHHFYGEPLDRDPRNAQRPGGPQRVDIKEAHIVHGMDMMREEVQKKDPSWDFPGWSGGDSGQVPGLMSAAVASVPSNMLQIPAAAAAALASNAPLPAAPAHVAGAPVVDERSALAHLKPIYDSQEESARALRAIFELCVARGVISREEYLDRLKRTPD